MNRNPTLSPSTFRDAATLAPGQAMTVQGTVNKTAVLLLFTIIAAGWTWRMSSHGHLGGAWITGSAIGGFIVAMVTTFRKTWAPLTAPIYAVLEGLFLGAVSCLYERQMPGIVLQAVMLTFGTLAALLAAYSMGLIRVTGRFRNAVIAATGGIMLFYLASFVLGFFHIQIPGIFGNGALSIGISVVVVIVAALNLVLDFNLIETGAQAGAPKFMEWYGGFALLVTLIWLYLEILRLLTKLRGRN